MGTNEANNDSNWGLHLHCSRVQSVLLRVRQLQSEKRVCTINASMSLIDKESLTRKIMKKWCEAQHDISRGWGVVQNEQDREEHKYRSASQPAKSKHFTKTIRTGNSLLCGHVFLDCVGPLLSVVVDNNLNQRYEFKAIVLQQKAWPG